MSTRTIQTEEIQSQTGLILASALSRFAIDASLTIDDLEANATPTKQMLLDAVGFLYPPPVYFDVDSGTQLTAVMNEEGEDTWAYRIDYTDSQFANFGQIPNVTVLRGQTCNFVPWLCDDTNLDIYLPDYDGSGLTTVDYTLKIAL